MTESRGSYSSEAKAVEQVARDPGRAGDAAPLVRQDGRHGRGGDQTVGRGRDGGVEESAGRGRAIEAGERDIDDGAYSGSIVSLHDGNATTAKALPKIIKGLKGKGYTLVTVNTLFAGDIRPGDVAYGLNDVQRDAE